MTSFSSSSLGLETGNAAESAYYRKVPSQMRCAMCGALACVGGVQTKYQLQTQPKHILATNARPFAQGSSGAGQCVHSVFVRASVSVCVCVCGGWGCRKSTVSLDLLIQQQIFLTCDIFSR